MTWKQLIEKLQNYDKDDIVVKFIMSGEESYGVFLKGEESDRKLFDIKKTQYNKLIKLGYDQEFNIG